MKSFISTLLFLLAALAPSAVCAQTVVLKTQSKAAICSQESFDKAEDFYNRSKYSSELLGRAERELKEITADCADYSWSYQAEIYLRDVQERAAERNFLIARYCWGLFQNGKFTSLVGILFRLNKITEEYPNYSQIVLVRQLLDEVNRRGDSTTRKLTKTADELKF